MQYVNFTAFAPPKQHHKAGMSAVFESLATSRHLLEMYRRQLPEGKLRRRLERLANRLLKVSAELEILFPSEK